MCGTKLDVAHMTIEEYVELCMSQTPDALKSIFDIEYNRIQLSNIYSLEYVRRRYSLLESNCKAMYRKYLAAMRALEDVVGHDEALRMCEAAIVDVPSDIQEIPDL